MTKTCTKCGVTKPVDAFHKHPRGAFGVMSRCKSCASLYAKARYPVKKEYFAAKFQEYYQRNHEHCLEKAKEWRLANLDRTKTALSKWRAENKPRTRQHAKSWQAKNKDAVQAIKRAWTKRNPGYQKEYYEKNKDRITARTVAWQEAHPERAAAFLRANRAKRQDAFVEHVDPAVVYERDMGLCQICGLPIENDDFHLDHRIPFAHGGQHSYENCQSAHAVCNMRKHSKLPEYCAHLWRRS
jgi:5-methylcytosine-specific restriction endonuclease McrA